jgi:hypothetical protein
MHGASIHTWGEEIEMWSTIAVNASIIFGGIPAIIVYLRKLPRQRIIAVGMYGAVIGVGMAFAALIVDLAFAPPSLQFGAGRYSLSLSPVSPEARAKYEELKAKGVDDVTARCEAMSSGNSSSVGGCIIIESGP